MGLADSQVMDVGNLARFFTDADDRPSLFEHDLKTFRQRADYMLSSVSLAYAMRDRIRDRTIHFIPRYRQFARTTNEFNFQYEQEHAPIAVDATPTYDALRRFLARARQEGVTVCFVAFRPRPETADSPAYAIDPKVLGMIADAGMLHLDLRHMDELSTEMYEDTVHLNERRQADLHEAARARAGAGLAPREINRAEVVLQDIFPARACRAAPE